MLLVIVGERYRNQHQNRYDIHQDNAKSRKRQQRNMKFFIEQRLDIFPETVDMLSRFLLLLQTVNGFDIANVYENKRYNYE